MELVALNLGKNLASLEVVVNKEDILKSIKLTKRSKATIKATVNKIKTQLFQCQNDQEKCYILCRRFLIMMDYIQKTSDDPNYYRQYYMTDIQRVKNLLEMLKLSLEKRYLQLARENNAVEPLLFGKPALSDLSISSGYTSSEPGPTETTPYIKPTGSTSEPTTKEKNPYFKDIFISAVTLYKLLHLPPSGANENLLIVDIRQEEDYKKCRIELEHGTLINIPGVLIKPGLSANALGQKYLTGTTKQIWDNRDQYSLIVLVDAETERYNFQGSKLERLRSFLVEWDINRTYLQDPVVLEGGVREYVEFYPTEVSDSVIYMSQRNSEMDEILVLEAVSYPESGSLSTEDKMKLREKDSLADVTFRVNRDFPEDMETNEYSAPVPNDQIVPIEDSTVPQPNQLADITGVFTKSAQTDAAAGDLTNRIRAALEAEKTDLLKDARFKKPKPGPSSNEVGVPPPVYRDKKPDLNMEDYPYDGKGFTGIANLHNNCFMNSILQCLKVLPFFREMYVKTDKYKAHARCNNPVMNNLFAQTLRTLWKGTDPQFPEVYWPLDFKKKIDSLNPTYKRHLHEDAFEFFIFLFDAISNECAYDLPSAKIMMDSERGWYSALDGRSSFLIKSFYHQIENSKSCCNCSNVSINYDIESTLMLPVPLEETHLQDLVDDYLKDAVVDDYCCTDCKSKASIIKRRTVVHAPEVLVVVLKRYGQFIEGDIRKVDTNIPFPTHNLVFGNFTYHLQGIVHHLGSLNCGHYFASARLDNNVWVLFNDEKLRVYNNFEEQVKELGREVTGFFYVLDDQL